MIVIPLVFITLIPYLKLIGDEALAITIQIGVVYTGILLIARINRSPEPCLHLSDTVRLITVSSGPPTGAFTLPSGTPRSPAKLI